MKVRVVSFLVVWACAILATCVMAAPSESGSSDNTEALDEDSQMALMWGTIADTIPMYLGDDSIDEDDDDTFTRRRRLMGGIHSKHPGSRRRFRGRRPRVFVPRRRPGSRGSSRNNVSPY